MVDGVQLAERRAAARTALVIPARLADLSRGAAEAVDWVETGTADVSLGGALLVREPALSCGPEWLIELVFPDAQASISCRAALARETLTHIGVAFVDMHDADRIRLAGVLADRQRGIAPAP